jgi:hypothetical protein
MAAEDELARLDGLAYHQVLHGDRPEVKNHPEAEEMGDLVLGDNRTEHHHHHHPPQQPQSVAGKLAPFLTTAAIAAGGGAGFFHLLSADGVDQAATPPPDDVDTEFGIELGR